MRSLRSIPLVAALVFAASLAALPAGAAPAVDELPDLAMKPPVWVFSDTKVGIGGIVVQTPPVCGTPSDGFEVIRVTDPCPAEAPGDRWLRFGTLLMNIGPGPLRLVGSRDPGDEVMVAKQRVRRSNGRWRTVESGATIRWAAEQDGHDHWHTDAMESYRLFPVAGPGDVLLGRKAGFCFFDGVRVRPGKRSDPEAYSFFSCAANRFTAQDAQEALSITVGMSRGWGDLYPWDYAGQRIDISDEEQVPDGDYLVCVTADPLDTVRESREDNNDAWSLIRIATEPDPYRTAVTVLASGRSACQGQLTYPIASAAAAFRRGGHDHTTHEHAHGG
ncbi:MAG: lysyl oxidase family protein [Chloroflexota bacterium]